MQEAKRDSFNLQRFISAQEKTYQLACQELGNGSKLLDSRPIDGKKKAGS